MPFNVNDIRAQLSGGGARASLFEVVMPFPTISNPGAASTKMAFTCKAASIPPSGITPIEVDYFGRKIKLPGAREAFAEWTTTIINDEDFMVYNAVQTWMNAMNSHEGNLPAAGSNPINYQSSADIIHYGKDGSKIKEVTMVNLWPSNLAALELGWENADAIEEFEVTWQYDYWTSPGTTT